MEQQAAEAAGAFKNEDTLLPIPENERILGLTSYLFAWLGGCVSIGVFTLGSSIVESGLTLIQAGLAMLIGSLILIAGLVTNDWVSYKYGVPYVIQLKSAFGTKGTIVPSMIRAVPAIVWYGVQSWLAGSAINEVSITLFGYDNMVIYFIAFHLVQMFLSFTGFKGVKWVENIGAVLIILALGYMFYVCMTQYDAEISSQLIDVEGTWGLPFFSAIVSFFGVNIAVLLNCGDYARELRPGYSIPKRGVAYFLAMVPPTVFMGLIGLMISTATGIANPIVAFSRALDNKVLVVVTLVFIIFAQLTTNLLSNAIPPIYALMDAFKFRHRLSALLVSAAAVAICPWLIIRPESAAGLDVFVQLYTVFLGPILAVLLTDYYIVRAQKINVDHLYDETGPFRGVNWAAMLSIAVGAAIGLVNVNLSFFFSFLPTAFFYYFAMKYMGSARMFRTDTVFEKK